MQKIILVGPKHSGKTSAGRELAALLGCSFTDLDEAIASACGRSPRALYTEGPEIFKEAETKALSGLLEKEENQVIAAGGGIIDNPAGITLLHGDIVLSIFLDIPAQTAWERISAEGELPPFLQTKNPRETHYSLHKRRSDAYRRIASLTIEVKNKNIAEIANEIADRLKH